MSTWTLLIFLYAGQGHRSAVAIPGFSKQENCIAVGMELEAQNSKLYPAWWRCVEVK